MFHSLRLFKNNPLNNECLKKLNSNTSYYALSALAGDSAIRKLPFSIRVLLESNMRKCDDFVVTQTNVRDCLNWSSNFGKVEIPFHPSRVLLQDFTGVPAVVDLAAMREQVSKRNPSVSPSSIINPLVPVDLVIDHSIQADYFGDKSAQKRNEEMEIKRNFDRFQFLKWGSRAFQNFKIVPPGSGIVHQVNLEHLARVVFFDTDKNGHQIAYPDSVVGTDSHTTMIDALSVVGWGVGGIEAEAVMLGQPTTMLLPPVVGVYLSGSLKPAATATDLVLYITSELRKVGVVGSFVEFFGPGVANLSLADRSTISNMCPEYGATVGFFPADKVTMDYLKVTGRQNVDQIHEYLNANNLFINNHEEVSKEIDFSSVISVNLAEIEPAVAGPKRPHDFVKVSDLQDDFRQGLTAPIGFKGFGQQPAQTHKSFLVTPKNDKPFHIKSGSVVLAAITSCTNTSNPSVMIAAGLLAKKAVEKGLSVNTNQVKTTLSPGSLTVEKYLSSSNLLEPLEKLGFYNAGYGCMTCIGNSGDLSPEITDTITHAGDDLVAVAVLSGNRNFEGRTHPLTRANFLASPPLVVAYALSGKVDIDFESEYIGRDLDGREVFLRDIWPTQEEIQEVINTAISSNLFTTTYGSIYDHNESWNQIQTSDSVETYDWAKESTYIHEPPYFNDSTTTETKSSLDNCAILLNLGDSVTTDHISPAGKIATQSAAANYLRGRGVKEIDFNTYGSRRSHDEIMARGTFANIRLVNNLVNKTGPYTTINGDPNDTCYIFDAAQHYIKEGRPAVVFAGAEYGSGSSRDWAAKGPFLLGIKAVIAKSFERIHRQNLVGMGILPLEMDTSDPNFFEPSKTLNGTEKVSIIFDPKTLSPKQNITVNVEGHGDLKTTCRIDTAVEVEYFKSGGILHYVLNQQLSDK